MSFCGQCGTQVGDGAFCPSCGNRTDGAAVATAGGPPAVPPSQPRKTNALAIASFVLSLMCGSILSVVLGHVALSQIRKTNEGGRGLAIAGLVIGYITLVLGIIFLIFLVLGAALMSVGNAGAMSVGL